MVRETGYSLCHSLGITRVSTVRERRSIAASYVVRAILLLPAIGAAFAQNCTTGKLHIVAQDSSGSFVQGVAVRVEADSGSAAATVTNTQGIAEFDNLNCGA